MIIKLKKSTSKSQQEDLVKKIKNYGCDVQTYKNNNFLVLEVLGNTNNIDPATIEAIENVEDVIRISSPYKLVSRDFNPKDTIVEVENIKIGGNNPIVVIAGPCSVENIEQIDKTAKYIKDNGGKILRGGIFKPRTSPYTFQGLEEKGLKLLEEVKTKYDLALACELTSVEQVNLYGARLDIIQIGARNMQNFDLLKAVGKQSTPVLLKRGMSATIEEWLLAAEYIMKEGNKNIILCERGIRTFENAYSNVTDLNAVSMLKKLTHLPIMVDPSHSTGKSFMVEDLALASVAVKANAIMLETHYKPESALSDAVQALDENQYVRTINKINALDKFIKSNKD